VYEDGDAVFQEMLRVDLRHAGEMSEHPADVRVPQTFQRAVRVAGLVGVLVMLPVSGNPLQHLTLDGHRAQRKQDELNDGAAAEAAVRGEAMEADGDAKSGDQVQAHQHHEIDRHHIALPQLGDGEDGGGKGHDHGD